MSVRQHLEILAHDVCYGARGFFRAPMFTLAAVCAVAIGVGAGTAVFSVVDRVLAAASHYPREARFYRELERLQPVYATHTERGRRARPWLRVYRI